MMICVLYDFGMGSRQRVSKSHIKGMYNCVLFFFGGGEILKLLSVPDSFMDGYVIGMTAHSSSIEGQHLKQQNIVLCEWKARIHKKKI